MQCINASIEQNTFQLPKIQAIPFHVMDITKIMQPKFQYYVSVNNYVLITQGGTFEGFKSLKMTKFEKNKTIDCVTM